MGLLIRTMSVCVLCVCVCVCVCVCTYLLHELWVGHHLSHHLLVGGVLEQLSKHLGILQCRIWGREGEGRGGKRTKAEEMRSKREEAPNQEYLEWAARPQSMPQQQLTGPLT